MRTSSSVLRKAVLDARDTLNTALLAGQDESIALDMLGEHPLASLDEIEKVMGDVYALLQHVSLDTETRAAVDELGCVHLKYFAASKQSEIRFGKEEGES